MSHFGRILGYTTNYLINRLDSNEKGKQVDRQADRQVGFYFIGILVGPFVLGFMSNRRFELYSFFHPAVTGCRREKTRNRLSAQQPHFMFSFPELDDHGAFRLSAPEPKGKSL